MAETDNGLPKVEGLEQLIADDPDFATQDKGQQATGQEQEPPAQQQVQTPPDAGQVEDTDLAGILKIFTSPDGKVNTKNLLKSYKEIQGAFTRVSQENADFKREMDRIREEAELRSYSTQQPPAPPNGQSWDDLFMQNPQQAITLLATQTANTQRIQEVLEEEAQRDNESFKERMAYVQMLAQDPQLAPLSHSPKGVKKLFEIADKQRKTMLERSAKESLKVIFGEDVDLEKLRAIVKGDGGTPPVNQTKNPQQTFANAYMPDTGTSTRTGADINTHMTQLEAIKQEAIKKGDPSGVAGALLREALLK